MNYICISQKYRHNLPHSIPEAQMQQKKKKKKKKSTAAVQYTVIARKEQTAAFISSLLRLWVGTLYDTNTLFQEQSEEHTT